MRRGVGILIFSAGMAACSQGRDEPPAAAQAVVVPDAPPRPPSRLETPPPPPPPPPPSGAAPTPAGGGAVTYYQHQYGVSRAEAERRVASQEHVGALNEWLHTAGPPGFSSLWLQHEPEYGVFISFKGNPDTAAVLARAHPSLRGDIRFVAAKRTAREIERDGDRVVAALQQIRTPWAGGYDVKTQKFAFNFSSQEAVATARRLVPADMLEDVVLTVGSVPVPLAR